MREALFAAAAPRPAGLQRPELPASERECDARLAQSAGREADEVRACGMRTAPLGVRWKEHIHRECDCGSPQATQREFGRDHSGADRCRRCVTGASPGRL